MTDRDTKPENLRFPVTSDWCERVRASLRGRGAMAKLADHVKLSRSQLSELLAGRYDTSDMVAPIHAYLGWPPPLSPTQALDAGDAVTGYASMPATHRTLIDTAVSVLRGVQGEQAKRALTELLQLCRSY
jgi:hypothetical protein